MLNVVEKITYSCATHVFPNSKELKKIIIQEKLCPEEKLKVIANGSSNGIATSYFNPAAFSQEQLTTLQNELQINPEDFVFIFIGRLVGDKGVNELVHAFKKLNQTYTNARLLLVGSMEPDLDPLEEETMETIGNHPHIIQAGYQPDIRPYLLISNLLVFPSYREGFPNVVMQAGAMGLPAIVSNINGCNEIIREGQNGCIIPPKDREQLYEKMEYYINHPDVLEAQTAQARTSIQERYEQKVVWRALLEEYRLLEKPVEHVQTSFQTN
ncbi:MAG: glycosyltransferase [Tannerellaceae bacterium]|nr:glycosyltransferase [Tannerellaceae bacterium]